MKIQSILITVFLLLFANFNQAQETVYNSIATALRVDDKTEVRKINLRQKGFYQVPFELQQFDSLEYLNLMKNKLGEIPVWFNQELSNLEELNFKQNLFEEIEEPLKLLHLKHLKLEKNLLDTIYFKDWKLPELQYLLLSTNKISMVDYGLCQFSELKDFSVENNQLRSLPKCKFNKLEMLRADNNQLTRIPFDINSLSELKEMHLSNNIITQVPDEIAACKKLEVLDLNNNNVFKISNEIGKLKELKMLLLTGNKLKSLPLTLSNCKQLKYIYLLDNPINEENIKELKSQMPWCQIVTQ